jgi:hypothetical protein
VADADALRSVPQRRRQRELDPLPRRHDLARLSAAEGLELREDGIDEVGRRGGTGGEPDGAERMSGRVYGPPGVSSGSTITTPASWSPTK